MSGAGAELARAELIEDGTVLSIVLDRPKGNVLTTEMMASAARAFEAHSADDRLRLVVLSGANRNFSFGVAVEEHTREEAPRMLERFHGLVRSVASYPVPVAAFVDGRCLGGAFELALCCHFVLSTPVARFACPEIKLAVYPPVLAAVGAHRLGGALAERLMFGAELDAESAARAGFVAEIVPGFEGVLDWYRESLRGLSAPAIRRAARVYRECSGLLAALGEPLARAERVYLEEVLPSRDAEEGIRAFIERRSPVWGRS